MSCSQKVEIWNKVGFNFIALNILYLCNGEKHVNVFKYFCILLVFISESLCHQLHVFCWKYRITNNLVLNFKAFLKKYVRNAFPTVQNIHCLSTDWKFSGSLRMSKLKSVLYSFSWAGYTDGRIDLRTSWRFSSVLFFSHAVQQLEISFMRIESATQFQIKIHLIQPFLCDID